MKAPTLKMDDASVRARHDKRKSWFLAEASRQASNRAMMAKCEGFYDGTQWEHEDAERVRERGQNPVVFNEVKPTIDWLIGTERKSRVDFVVVAADEGEAASDDATLKTKLLKYLDDANRAVFERSYAIEDAFKAGLGWMEVGLRGDPSGPPIYIGAESWRNILYDSQGSKRDLSDARYLFRIKVVDRDVAEALAKQEQGTLLTMELFDNLLFARQMEGEITLSLAEQFLTQPLTIRVAHEGNKYDYAKLNQPQDDGTFLNDITQRKASFVIGEQAWKLSYAEAAFDSLMQVLSQLASSAPQVVVGMLDVVFEMHPNLPRKKAILERIRQVNGQSDPDGKETPEQQAAKQQQQQVAQAQFEAQMAQIKASIRESQAKGEKLEAEAMAKRLEGLYMSAQAGVPGCVCQAVTAAAAQSGG